MGTPGSPFTLSAFCESINCHGAAIEVRKHGPATLLVVTGEVDAANAHHFDSALRRLTGAERPVLVDLSGVGFIGVQGLRGLLQFDEQCRRSGTAWVLVADTMVRRVLRIARPGQAVLAVGTVREAVRELSSRVPEPGSSLSTEGRHPG